MKRPIGQQAARQRIGPSARAALNLLACCPRMPTEVAAVLLDMRHTRSAAQLLLRLRTAGLADYKPVRPGPLVGSRVVRLWTLTPAGRTIVPTQPEPSEEGRSRLPYGQPDRRRDVARQPGLPILVVAYRLLAHVARELDGAVHVTAWEHPWIRTVRQAETGRAQHVRLPAAAALIHQHTNGGSLLRLLLLPDLGTLPVTSYRPVLRGLLAYASEADEKNEALLVVGVATGADSGARVAAWQALFEHVARRSGEDPLRARVLAWSLGLGNGRDSSQLFGSQAEQVFALVARHPLLTHDQLATLLGTSVDRIGRLVAQLTARDWLRAIPPGELPRDALALSSGNEQRNALGELTHAGRREAARRLLLSTTVATRYHGVLGKHGSTRRLLWHLAHTLGANAVFVALVLAARRVTERGGDDALEDWRSAAACARGRFRPDGYGCYRREGSRFGFFLEFDRGTERPSQYAAKLAAYYRHRDCGAAALEYAGFPTVLVVTTREAAELRFAHEAYVASERHGGKPLSLLLTRTDVIEATRDGILGPIWRTAGLYGEQPMRAYWLPGEPPNGSFTVTRRHVSQGVR